MAKWSILLGRTLQGSELSDAKIRDFRRLLITQVLMIASFVLMDLFRFLAFPWYVETGEVIFFAVLGFYVFLLWDLLRNYTNRPSIIIANLVFIGGVFVLGVVCVNPFFPMPVTVPYRLALTMIQFCLLSVELTVIYFTLNEFFRRDLGLSIRLWGSACIYLMIGLAFGSAYEMVCILDLECLGTELPLRTISFMDRIEFSLMILSGMDLPYPDAHGMVLSLATMEALFGQIYVVLIVARLLIK